MSENDDRSAARTTRDVLFQPFELVVAQFCESGRFEARLEIKNIDKRDKMHPGHIKAIPALALRVLAEPLQISLAISGISDVVLAGNVKNLLVGAFNYLLGGIPLFRLRQMADVPGMNDKGGLGRHSLYFGNRLAKGGGRIRIGRQVESDVIVADLDKGQLAWGDFRRRGRAYKSDGSRHPAAQTPDNPRPSPRQAFQQTAPVNARCAVQFLFVTIGHLALPNGVCVAPIQTASPGALFRRPSCVSRLRNGEMHFYVLVAGGGGRCVIRR